MKARRALMLGATALGVQHDLLSVKQRPQIIGQQGEAGRIDRGRHAYESTIRGPRHEPDPAAFV